MENIIFNELRYRDFLVNVGIAESIEKGANGKSQRKNYEIDFVATKGNKKVYIQSAFRMESTEKERQERNSLKNIQDSFKKIIVAGEDRKPRYDENGFLVVGIRQFLLDENILET